MAFIKLTGMNGDPLYINAYAIEAFYKDEGYTSIVPASTSNFDAHYTVRESPEEVMKIIEKDYIPF